MRLDRVAGGERSRLPADPADMVAHVAAAKRDVLLRVYRRRLRREDLEDCYSQATLELLARARRGSIFESPHHVSNALEQKFVSRISDRHRAAAGRSATETALANAVSLSDERGRSIEVSDHAASVADRVALRHELRLLREVADDLTPDQRLVLVSQVSLGLDANEFCRIHGWSGEKFRKVAQRARAKLRSLTADYEAGLRCRRLSEDLLAYAARVARDDQVDRVSRHLANCPACAAQLRELDGSARQVAALLPPVSAGAAPGLIKVLVSAAVGGHHPSGRPPPIRPVAGLRRVLRFVRHSPFSARTRNLPPGPGGARGAAAGGGAAAGTGGTLLGVGATKASLTALCVAGAAGGYAVCQHEGWVPWGPWPGGPGVAAVAHHHYRRGADRHRAAAFVARSRTRPATPAATEQSRVAASDGSPVTREAAKSPSHLAHPSVQREFGVQGAGRTAFARGGWRARRRAARAARAARRRGRRRSAGLGTVAPAARAAVGTGGGRHRPGRGSGEFLGAARASRGAGRSEFGF